jgi:two-component system response regulator DevR
MSDINSTPIRVMLVDDSELVRRGIAAVLASAGPSIKVVGEAGNVATAVSECLRIKPDIVLMDIRMPDGQGFDACRQIIRNQPATKVIVLTSDANDSFVDESVAAGAQGYLMKEIDPSGLIQAVRDVAAGRSILDPDTTNRVLRLLRGGAEGGADLGALSPQERRVLALVAEGMTNKQVGEQLSLSENTVKNYLVNVFEKLHVKRRSQAGDFVRQSQRRRAADLMRMPVSRLQSRAGFTILEVGMASFVLAMAIATAVTVLQHGLRAVDTAGNMTLAGKSCKVRWRFCGSRIGPKFPRCQPRRRLIPPPRSLRETRRPWTARCPPSRGVSPARGPWPT